jgi:hypothetical protein
VLQIARALVQSEREGSMRLVQLRAPKDEDAACLMRELSVYAPRRAGRAIVIELEASTVDLLALLSAIGTCVAANDIRSVFVDLEGEKYTLAAR